MGHHAASINDVTEEESDNLLRWFVNLVVENHDLQVRLRWQNSNDLGKSYFIFPAYDTRRLTVFHAATYDYEDLGTRTGHRAVGLGERPNFDRKSTSRREALEKQEK